jgi:hypothetical protein
VTVTAEIEADFVVLLLAAAVPEELFVSEAPAP